jgi:hypothetical protein
MLHRSECIDGEERSTAEETQKKKKRTMIKHEFTDI